MGYDGDPVLQDILVLVKGEGRFFVGGDAAPEYQPGLRPVDNLDPAIPEELPDNNRGKLLFYDRLQGLVLKDRDGERPDTFRDMDTPPRDLIATACKRERNQKQEVRSKKTDVVRRARLHTTILTSFPCTTKIFRGGFPLRRPVILSSESARFRISSSGVPAGTVILLLTFPLTWMTISLSSSWATSVQ